MMVNFGIFELVAHFMYIKEVNSFHKGAPSQVSDRVKYLSVSFLYWHTSNVTSIVNNLAEKNIDYKREREAKSYVLCAKSAFESN